MQDSARGSAAAREGESVQGSNVSAKGRSRWSAEEKARVVRESLRSGKRVGEVAGRYNRRVIATILETTMAKGAKGRGGAKGGGSKGPAGWPSKTGNPSGRGRDNAPAKKK